VFRIEIYSVGSLILFLIIFEMVYNKRFYDRVMTDTEHYFAFLIQLL